MARLDALLLAAALSVAAAFTAQRLAAAAASHPAALHLARTSTTTAAARAPPPAAYATHRVPVEAVAPPSAPLLASRPGRLAADSAPPLRPAAWALCAALFPALALALAVPSGLRHRRGLRGPSPLEWVACTTAGATRRAWTRDRRDPMHDSTDPEQVQLAERVAATLAKRDELRTSRQYDEADALQAELSAGGVQVDDRIRTWRTGGGPQAPALPRSPAARTRRASPGRAQPASGPRLVGWACARPTTDPELVAKVSALLAKREAHRARKEYDEADAIEVQVREMGIKLYKKRSLWIELAAPWQQSARDPTPAAPELQAQVTELLARRDEHVNERAYDAAIAIRDQLQQMGVRIDDSRRVWTTAPLRKPAASSE